MMRPPVRPKIGVLALTLELYETLAPAVRGQREQWVRRQLLPALETNGRHPVRRGRLSAGGHRGDAPRLRGGRGRRCCSCCC